MHSTETQTVSHCVLDLQVDAATRVGIDFSNRRQIVTPTEFLAFTRLVVQLEREANAERCSVNAERSSAEARNCSSTAGEVQQHAPRAVSTSRLASPSSGSCQMLRQSSHAHAGALSPRGSMSKASPAVCHACEQPMNEQGRASHRSQHCQLFRAADPALRGFAIWNWCLQTCWLAGPARALAASGHSTVPASSRPSAVPPPGANNARPAGEQCVFVL